MPRALLLGATGLVGSRYLLADGWFATVIVVAPRVRSYKPRGLMCREYVMLSRNDDEASQPA